MNSQQLPESNFVRAKSYKKHFDQLKKQPFFFIILSCSLGIFFLTKGYLTNSTEHLTRFLFYIFGGILITPILALLFHCYLRLIKPTPKVTMTSSYDEVIV